MPAEQWRPARGISDSRPAVRSLPWATTARSASRHTEPTIVRLDGEDLLVDTSILHVEPLALRDGARLDDPAHRVRVERSGGERLIWWTPRSRDTEMVPAPR